MKIPLKPGYEAKVLAIKPIIYSLGNKTCQLVYKTSDEMHCLGRFKFMSKHISFTFPIFIVWKLDAKSKKKSRAIVDIQKLNNMVFPDSYSLPLQSEIITNIQRYTNLAVLDAAFFFYQWFLYLDHHFMFIVVTHRGQEIFKVLIIRYINLIIYVQ